MTDMGCMILAAGFGTRMGTLTAERPKPLIEVAGRALIDHALDQARGAGAAPIVVNGHYRAAQMAVHLAEAHDVTFLEETPKILDSGGGVKNALPHLGAGPFFTLNSDAVWRGGNPLREFLGAWEPEVMDGLMLLVPQDRAVGRKGGGDFAQSADGRLTPDKAGLVWTGAQILKPELFADTPDGPFSMWEIWRGVMACGRLFGAVYSGMWADVGHPEGIALAEAMVEGGDAVPR